MSMSRRANALDYALMESFFKTLKVERIYQAHYETRAHARLDIVDWIESYYNRQRLHSSIGYCVPVKAEEMLLAARVAVRESEAGSANGCFDEWRNRTPQLLCRGQQETAQGTAALTLS